MIAYFGDSYGTHARDGDARAVTTCLREEPRSIPDVLDSDGYTSTSAAKLVETKRDVYPSESSTSGILRGSSHRHVVTARASPSRAASIVKMVFMGVPFCGLDGLFMPALPPALWCLPLSFWVWYHFVLVLSEHHRRLMVSACSDSNSAIVSRISRLFRFHPYATASSHFGPKL